MGCIQHPSPLHWPFLESSWWGTTFAWLYPGADTWTNGFGREEMVLFGREAGNPLCRGSAKMTLRPRTPLISIPLTVSTRQSPSEFSQYTQGRARGECAASNGALKKIGSFLIRPTTMVTAIPSTFGLQIVGRPSSSLNVFFSVETVPKSGHIPRPEAFQSLQKQKKIEDVGMLPFIPPYGRHAWRTTRPKWQQLRRDTGSMWSYGKNRSAVYIYQYW